MSGRSGLSARLAGAIAAAALLSAALPVLPAHAEKPAAAARKDSPAKDPTSPLGSLGGGKEPIKIDADRLDVFDRENKAIFAGNVVAVQGESTIRCSTMTVHYKRGKDAKDKDAAKKDQPAEAEDKPKDAAGMGENGIQKVDCAGPVTVVQKDQVATGDNAVFDQTAKRIVLTGNVVLSQCQNVTRGQRLVYDMNTGRANMDPVPGGRVSALFVPGEKSDTNKAAKGCPQPAGVARNPDKAAPKPVDAAKTDAAKTDPAKADAKTRAQAN